MKLLIIKWCDIGDELEYRLNAYHNFSTKIQNISEVSVKVYGYKHEQYSEDKNIHDVIKLLYGDEFPDVIYLWSPQVLASSDFSNIPSKKYIFWTDTPSTNQAIVDGIKKHTIQFDAVFHNYIYELDILKSLLDSKRYIHHPCWSSDIYKYDGRDKTIDFLLTGTITNEYEFRYKYRKLNLNGSIVDCLGAWSNTKEDNDIFKNRLLSSKFSLVDGGINGRTVPRYFESSLAKSVVVSPDLGEELVRNGFKDGFNCVLFDRGDSYVNISSKINEAINNWKYLSDNAFDLAYDNHTTDCRIHSLLEEFNK